MDEVTGMIAGAPPAHAAKDEPAAATSGSGRAEKTADGGRASAPPARAPQAASEERAASDGGRAPAPPARTPQAASEEHAASEKTEQTGEPTAGARPPEPPDEAQPDAPDPPRTSWPASPGFRERGRMRRRLAFLRRARELGYRDLGGLVFNLHRFGQRHDELVLAKLGVLERLDTELRSLEGALRERRAATVLRVPGITACPRCAAIHASEDRFCPNCGLQLGRHPDLPIAGPTEAAAPAGNGPAAEAPAAATAPSDAGALPAAAVPASAAAPDSQTTPTHATGAPAGADDRDEPTEILGPPLE